MPSQNEMANAGLELSPGLQYLRRVSENVRMVVGLGNPGQEYQQTRHNIGFEVLDRLARREGAEFKRDLKWKADATKLPSGIWLLKPQTFMNLSGRAVATASRYFKIPPEAILVVYDDVAFPLGTVMFRRNGGPGGHNGIDSLITELGTREFPRLKVGIGGAEGKSMTGHVLGRFRPDEREPLENGLARAVDAVQLALSQGVARAANAVNTQNKPTKKSEPEVREPDRPEHERERE